MRPGQYQCNPLQSQCNPLRPAHVCRLQDLGPEAVVDCVMEACRGSGDEVDQAAEEEPDEKDDGGHLTLYNPKTKEEKIFEYGENKIVLFPNTPLSWHYITDRKESKYSRRFICMRLEAKLKLHNYQTKNGKDVMIYEDLKNNYE